MDQIQYDKIKVKLAKIKEVIKYIEKLLMVMKLED